MTDQSEGSQSVNTTSQWDISQVFSFDICGKIELFQFVKWRLEPSTRMKFQLVALCVFELKTVHEGETEVIQCFAFTFPTFRPDLQMLAGWMYLGLLAKPLPLAQLTRSFLQKKYSRRGVFPSWLQVQLE